MLGMDTSSVTYQDLVREVWRVPSMDLGLALDFLRFLQTRQRPSEAVSVDKTNAGQMPIASPVQRTIKSRPAAELLKWAGSINLGEGNALEDTERLYDGSF